MRVQIAFNSDNLDFCIRDTEGYQRTNITFKSTEKARGKVYVTINVNTNKELYFLYIYKKKVSTRFTTYRYFRLSLTLNLIP